MPINHKFFIATAIAACALPLSAQSLLQTPPRDVVQLSSVGAVEVQQDLLTLTLSTTKEGADPAQVQNHLRQVLDAALLQAKLFAQPAALEVKTGAFSLQPRYGRDGKISTWAGFAELILEGRDFVRIGSAAGRIQGLTIANASFSLSREVQNKVEAQAQEIAIERFKAKATDIARGFGFTSFTLREVAVNSTDAEFSQRLRMVGAPMKAMASDAPVPLEAGKSTVQVQVSGSVQLR